jgi:tyrosyl-tRNA synthetase
MLIIDIIFESKMSSSKSEARRLIKQGAVSIDGEKIDNPNLTLTSNNICVIKVGKRRFLKLI